MHTLQDGEWIESQPETHTRTTTKYDRKGNAKKPKVKDISVGTRKGFLGLGGKRK